MTDWVRVDDWGTVKVGDFIRVEKGRECFQFEVRWVGANQNPGTHLFNTFSKSDGWTLFVEPRPVPALPTEPGVHADKDGSTWIVDDLGLYLVINGVIYKEGSPKMGKFAAQYAPFTRLEPVPVTAKKVLEALEEQAIHTVATRDEDHRSIYDSIWDEVARQFGVTND